MVQQPKMLTLDNLRELLILTSSKCVSVLPPPEFLSSITSTRLSEITINLVYLPHYKGPDEVLDAIGAYDGALCKLSDQLEPSTGREKLILTLEVEEELSGLDRIIPRFREVGVLKIVVLEE
jgi:hypothetical protein